VSAGAVAEDDDHTPVTLTFLGTGNFLARDRYWNSFVIDGTVLVEPAPTVLPHLHRSGIPVGDIEVVVISHFHPDHTFGWPFFLLGSLEQRSGRDLYIVGPPGVRTFLDEMMALGGVTGVQREAAKQLNVQYVEVDGQWQKAGSLRFRAIEVEHVPHLRCYGYLFERGSRIIGYSGDTRTCAGLHELASAADPLVLECDGQHADGVHIPVTHMNEESMRALRQQHPGTTFILTHMGTEVDPSGMTDVIVPDDFAVLTV
jgi:ribonuclease Z